MEHFGEHVTIDGYGGEEALLDSKENVLACLNELPAILGMSQLAEPVVYYTEGNNAKDPGGWTGVVVIAESHISVHTFPKRGFVSADVYTCRNGMDKETVLKFFEKTFGLQKIETNFLKRGLEYPENNIYS
jgi:S-adenosylmethionine decarboxylase